jgi:hypothetical protein
MILIQGPRLQSPYNQISLENSGMNIERVEEACAAPFQGAARLWRRIARSIGVDLPLRRYLPRECLCKPYAVRCQTMASSLMFTSLL